MSDITVSFEKVCEQQKEEISSIIANGENAITDFFCALGRKFYEVRIACHWKHDRLWESVEDCKKAGGYPLQKTWTNWLKIQGWKIAPFGDSAKSMLIDQHTVAFLESFPIAVDAIKSSGLPLPLPTSIYQLQPYKFNLEEKEVDKAIVKVFADDQSSFVKQWQTSFEAHKSKLYSASEGAYKPPTQRQSRQTLKETGFVQTRQSPSTVSAKDQTIDVTPRKAQPAPAKPQKDLKQIEIERVQEELRRKEAERLKIEQKEIEKVKDYYRLMRSLYQDSEQLKTFLEGVIVNEGSNGLHKMRSRDVGLYSMNDDVQKLLEVINLLKEVHTMMTQEYEIQEPSTIHVEGEDEQ